MLVHNAVDYLATAGADDAMIEDVINSDICAKWINLSDYALDTLSANANIKSVMDDVDKYGYGEWGAVGQVPNMTSAPASGVVEVSSDMSGRPGWYVFNDSYKLQDDNGWVAYDRGAQSLTYTFPEPICIRRAKIVPLYTAQGGYYNRTRHYKYQAYNGSEWIDISDEFTFNASDFFEREDILSVNGVENTNKYTKYKLYIFADAATISVGCNHLQFLAYAPLGNVPIMTANNAPYGVASAYQVFDGNASTSASGTDFSYQSVNPICVKKFECSVNGGTLQGSNDGSTYTNISDPSSNTTYYMYHKVHFASSQTVHTLQFYGRELSLKNVIEPMTGNTSSQGTASASSTMSPYYPFKAFDGNKDQVADSSFWHTEENKVPAWLRFEFNNATSIRGVAIYPRYPGGSSQYGGVRDFVFQGSNTGNDNDWTPIVSGTVPPTTSTPKHYIAVFDEVTYKYYQLYISTSYSPYYAFVTELELLNTDYSEKEFASGSTAKWIYDHGVELETLTISGTGTKGSNAVTLSASGATATASITFTSGTWNTLNGKTGLNASGSPRIICGSGYAAITDRASLDVSAITGANNTGASQTASGTVDIDELWLE